MRFACVDVRGHIVSLKKRPRTFVAALWSLATIERPRMDFREILSVVRFSTFSTLSARSGRSQAIRIPRSVSPWRKLIGLQLVRE